MFGILERVKQFAKEATNYISSIVGSGSEVKPAESQKKDSPISVHNTKNQTVDTPEDKFVKQATKPENKKDTPKQTKKVKTNISDTHIFTKNDILKKGKEIDELKKKYNISDNEYYEIILPRVGFSKGEFLKLNNNEKMEVLNIIKGAMNVFIHDKYIDNPNLDMAEIIGDAAADFKKASNEGGIKSFKEFDKTARPYIAKINKDFAKAKTEEEKREILILNRLAFEADINIMREAELKKCKTDEERALVNQKYDSRVDAFEGYIHTNFLADNGNPRNAYLSTYLRRGKYMANGTERAIRTFSGEARCCAAGTFTHGRRIQQAQKYSELGDQISATAYGKSTQAITQYMRKEDLEQYEADAFAFKQEYYKNPGKYSFITEEHLTQESVGTAMGATLNKNMSAEEKAAFIHTWNEHAKNFSDYDQVRGQYYTEIKQYLAKHPEAKQGIEDIKTKYQEKYGRDFEIPWAAKKRYDNRNSAINQNNDNRNNEANAKIRKATPQQLEHALTTRPFEEVRKQFKQNSDREFADVVLHNPKLKGHKQHIISFIKTLSAEDLSNITKGCSTDMFLFVLRNISPDKAGRLYDLSKGDKCYAARKLGEKIIEEGRENAAA